MPLAPGIAAALSDIVGPSHLVSSHSERAAGVRSTLEDLPDASVYPGTTDEVAQIMRGAWACDLAVLTAENVLMRDGDAGQIVLNLSRLDRILELNSDELIARVQPEASTADFKHRISMAGLVVSHVRRGESPVVNGYVLEVEGVTQSGRVIRAVRPPFSSRYDVVDLVLRTAGVLCVITEITIALRPDRCTDERRRHGHGPQ